MITIYPQYNYHVISFPMFQRKLTRAVQYDLLDIMDTVYVYSTSSNDMCEHVSDVKCST